jgi:hypothetical protein
MAIENLLIGKALNNKQSWQQDYSGVIVFCLVAFSFVSQVWLIFKKIQSTYGLSFMKTD